MNSIATQQKRNARVQPSNGSGSFSFTNGNPIIKFSIADTEALLVGSEVRLCGKFKLRWNGTAQPTWNKGANMDRIAGIGSVIQQISIGSRRYSANTLEVIHNYPRLMSSLYANGMSSKGMRTTTWNETGAVGKGCYNNQFPTALGTMNATDPILVAGRKHLLQEFDFAMRLPTGLLTHNNIDLSLLGGLEISIFLAPNFASAYGVDLTSSVDYVVENPYLTLPLLYKSPEMIAQQRARPQEVFSFMSYQSLYSVVDSTDQSVVHRLNQKNLLSVIQNYIPVSYINNIQKNGLAGWNAGGLTNIEFHRDGTRYPLEYNIEVDKQTVSTRDNEQQEQTSLSPQVLWNSQSAYRNVKDIKRSQITPSNLLGVNKEDSTFTTGVGWDLVSGAGINVMGTITYDLKTKLENPTNNDATNPNHTGTVPFAQYSYYLARNNLLINKGQGIAVM